jgi:hypothetical protein
MRRKPELENSETKSCAEKQKINEELRLESSSWKDAKIASRA